MSSTPKPAWASAMSSIRSRPRPPTPVSTRTSPAPRCSAHAFPCGTPGQGQGSFNRQIPGWIRSVRGLTTCACAIDRSSQLPLAARRDKDPPVTKWLRAGGGLEELHHAGDGEAESAGQGAPVGDADRDHVAVGADEGGDAGDHEEDRADLVDEDDPTAEVLAADPPPGAGDVDHRDEAGDQEEQAADDVRVPDQAVLLGRRQRA